MSKKQKRISIIIIAVCIAAIFIGINLVRSANGEGESVQVSMRDAVLHETNKIPFFGMEVNPGLISAFVITGIFLIFGLIVRFILVPRFKLVPGRFQLILETVVDMFRGMAKSNSPHLNGFLGAYIFTAGAYIFVGTIFELFGFQVTTTEGLSISLPAPLADINGAIVMGCLSYLIIMSGGIIVNGIKGIGKTLKDFSLPISMSFRLFGALLSGALVTELVYYYPFTRYGIPVIVGVLFTLLHALIQAYVLTTLTSVFYGEVSEKIQPKVKVKKEKGRKRAKSGVQGAA